MMNMHDDYINVYQNLIHELQDRDPQLFQMLKNEYVRQKETLMLVASASIAYPEVLAASSSNIMNVTLEGYIGNRFHAGTQVADKVEALAIERAKNIFKAKYANVQPLSGALANNSILFGFLNAQDTILSLSLNSGGHLTHGAKVSITGKYFNVINYGLDDNGYIDYNQIMDLATKYKPKIIIAGASAYTRLINYKLFREIADSVNSLLLVDISHISGLTVAGVIPSPIDYAHFTTMSTYKQLYGPRGGLICIGKDYDMLFEGKPLSKMIDSAVFPGAQGTPDMSAIAAKAAAFKKIDSVYFQDKMKRVCNFAKVMARLFIEKGYYLVSGGTDNHMILIDILRSKCMTGVIAEKALEKCNIIINKNMLYNDTRSPLVTSGIRLGTNSIAFIDNIDDNSLVQIVDLIDKVLSSVKVINDKKFELDEKFIADIKQEVKGIIST